MNAIIKNIGIFVVTLYLPINLFSQSVEQKEDNYYKLNNTLTNETQSSFDLDGFEGRAVQKVEELAGYVEIISNKDYDIKFREHALTLAKKLFYNENMKISNSDKNLSNLNIMDINNYLNSILKTGYAKIVVEIDNKQYIQNLSQNKESSYSGRLFFSQTNSYYTNDDVKNQTTEKKEVEIILVKTEKSFGKKTKSVWSVYLGNIKLVDTNSTFQK